MNKGQKRKKKCTQCFKAPFLKYSLLMWHMIIHTKNMKREILENGIRGPAVSLYIKECTVVRISTIIKNK